MKVVITNEISEAHVSITETDTVELEGGMLRFGGALGVARNSPPPSPLSLAILIGDFPKEECFPFRCRAYTISVIVKASEAMLMVRSALRKWGFGVWCGIYIVSSIGQTEIV